MSDNVIRPTFGKKVPVQEPQKTKVDGFEASLDEYDVGPLQGATLERAGRDLVYMVSNQDYVQSVRDKIHEISDYIFALANFSPNDGNIKIRREGLQSATFQDICTLVEQSHQLQWGSQPSYFGALALEYHYRCRNAISLLPKE